MLACTAVHHGNVFVDIIITEEMLAKYELCVHRWQLHCERGGRWSLRATTWSPSSSATLWDSPTYQACFSLRRSANSVVHPAPQSAVQHTADTAVQNTTGTAVQNSAECAAETAVQSTADTAVQNSAETAAETSVQNAAVTAAETAVRVAAVLAVCSALHV